MEITPKRIEFAKITIIVFVVKELANAYKITTEEAFIKFIKTRTYELLRNNNSFLYLESREYVLDMFHNEITGNIEEWMKI